MRFAGIYGHIWLSTYKNEQSLSFAKKEWAEALKKFENQTIKKALFHTREQNPLPPTLPQFTAICKSVDKRNKDFWVMHQQDGVTTKVVALKHLSNIKKILERDTQQN